jgi:hypothetical protein
VDDLGKINFPNFPNDWFSVSFDIALKGHFHMALTHLGRLRVIDIGLVVAFGREGPWDGKLNLGGSFCFIIEMYVCIRQICLEVKLRKS